MKRLISYPLMFIMLLMLSVGLHAKEPTKTKKAPEFLFVITAKSGEIKQVGKNRYTLTMKHTDVDHVLMFSDRPYRLAKYITADELAKMWKVGINSFEKDPPNAGLVAHGFKHATVVELLGMDVNKQQVVYHFSFLDGPVIVSGQLISISLFIDDWDSHNDEGQYMSMEEVDGYGVMAKIRNRHHPFPGRYFWRSAFS